MEGIKEVGRGAEDGENEGRRERVWEIREGDGRMKDEVEGTKGGRELYGLNSIEVEGNICNLFLV